MPKYKPHTFIQGIEHKHCGSICKKWKPLDQFGKYKNGKQSYCKVCAAKKNKQYSEKRKKEREAVPTGFLVCLNLYCTEKWLQPINQFKHPHVRNNTFTKRCLACRNKEKEAKKRKEAPCQKVWDEWRKKNKCIECSKDPTHVHNYLVIEADHLPEFKKVENCSYMAYWKTKSRGVPALKAELKKCQALCKFHHRLVTWKRSNKTEKLCILRKRAVINVEKHNRGCCFLCERVLKKGEECAFDFDHRDDSTKFMYNGKTSHPSNFVKLPDALFDKQWPLEQAKCDLLCANCHVLKSKVNKDGYKK